MTHETVRFTVTHVTEYRYSLQMSDGYTVAHLLARDTPMQRVLQAEVEVSPEPDEFEEHTDLFGNRVVRLGVHRPHDHLTITGRCTVDVDLLADGGWLPPAPTSWDRVVELVRGARGDRAAEVGPFAAHTAATPRFAELDELVGDLFVPGTPLVDVVRSLSTRIHREFAFDPEFSDVSTPIAAVFAARRGVCQDFAHLMLACLRSRGLAARYISGYIETEPPPRQEKLTGSDASRLVQRVVARHRLARRRPDERSGPATSAHHRRLGPRLLRRHPRAWGRDRPGGRTVALRRRRRRESRTRLTRGDHRRQRKSDTAAVCPNPAGRWRPAGAHWARAGRPVLPSGAEPRQSVRRVVRGRRAHHGHLLPSVVPSHDAEAPERVVLPGGSGRTAARLSCLQALPSGRIPRLARVERARRPRRPGDAAHRRRSGGS